MAGVRLRAAKRGGGWALALLAGSLTGCGTMRVSDTTRTASEQLLISRSIDDTVSNLDFRRLAGRRVYLDDQYLAGVTDKGYLISSLRQHLLACGCLLQEDRKKATYVVEARAGSVGTDRNDMLIGIPQMSIPAVMPGIPGTMIPEIALAKKTRRRAVAKVAVFAYNRISGDPVMQSGTVQSVSNERNGWLFGAGPFQRGTLIRGTEFDDQRIVVPLLDRPSNNEPSSAVVSVTQPAVWQRGPLPEGDDDTARVRPASRPKSPAEDRKDLRTSHTSAPSAEPSGSEKDAPALDSPEPPSAGE